MRCDALLSSISDSICTICPLQICHIRDRHWFAKNGSFNVEIVIHKILRRFYELLHAVERKTYHLSSRFASDSIDSL